MTPTNPHPLSPIFNLIDNAILRYREKVRIIQKQEEATPYSTTHQDQKTISLSPSPIALHYADKANQLLAAKRAMLELWEGKE